MTPSRSVRYAMGTYRVLVRLLPRRLRVRHATEMAQLFEELLQEAYHRVGVWGVFAVWVRASVDLVVGRGPGVRRVGRRRVGPCLDQLGQDVRLSLRTIRRRPGTPLLAVASLAVGMAITVGIFTFADGVLWKEWNFHRADRMVQIFERRDQYLLPSWAIYTEVQEQMDLFTGVLASQLDLFALGAGDGAATVTGERVSPDYFRVLGVTPQLGRYPSVADPVSSGPVPVVISHYVWERWYGHAFDIIGREIRLNGHPGVVVAVAPMGFDGTKWGVSADLWVPMPDWALADGWTDWEDDPNNIVTVMARLADGTDVATANAVLASLASGLVEEDPQAYRGMTLEATDRLRGDMGPEIGIAADVIAGVAIFGGILVLLMGCGNVAGLLMARGILRSKEIAVRRALGAGRERIISQLLTESTVLALVAAAAGLFLSRYGTQALLQLLPTFEFRVNFPTEPGTRGVAFASALAVLAVLASGLLPARQLVRTDLAETIKADGRGSLSAARSRLLGALVVGIVATSTLALYLSGVFAGALSRTTAQDPGFSTEHRLMGVVPIRLAGYRWNEAAEVFEDLERRLGELPGVKSVGFATAIPVGESMASASVYAADRGYGPGEPGIRAFRSSVSDDYFDAMGTRIVAGRSFGPDDGPSGPWVAIVNEELGERLWPGENPLGRNIRFGLDDQAVEVEVVGVAQNGVYFMVGESPEPAVFASFRQWPESQAMVVLETEGDPLDAAGGLMAEVAGLDPDVPVQRIRTASGHFRDALWLYRLGSGIGGTVSIVALLLAGAGIFGVMSFTMGARRHEMGIRRALGARAFGVVGLSLWAACRLTVIGLCVGAILSYLAGQLLRASLPGVYPWDALTLGLVPSAVMAVGALSGLVPGITASRTDPAAVLNAET